MKAKIQKWGNSLGVRIPSIIAKDLSLDNGATVDIFEDSGQIVIRPIKKRNLKMMLDSITDGNVHTEIDFGSSEGKENW